jgi:hypothetical protein
LPENSASFLCALWRTSVTAESQRACDVFNCRTHKAHRVRTETNQKLENHSYLRLATGNDAAPFSSSARHRCRVLFAPHKSACSCFADSWSSPGLLLSCSAPVPNCSSMRRSCTDSLQVCSLRYGLALVRGVGSTAPRLPGARMIFCGAKTLSPTNALFFNNQIYRIP